MTVDRTSHSKVCEASDQHHSTYAWVFDSVFRLTKPMRFLLHKKAIQHAEVFSRTNRNPNTMGSQMIVTDEKRDVPYLRQIPPSLPPSPLSVLRRQLHHREQQPVRRRQAHHHLIQHLIVALSHSSPPMLLLEEMPIWARARHQRHLSAQGFCLTIGHVNFPAPTMHENGHSLLFQHHHQQG